MKEQFHYHKISLLLLKLLIAGSLSSAGLIPTRTSLSSGTLSRTSPNFYKVFFLDLVGMSQFCSIMLCSLVLGPAEHCMIGVQLLSQLTCEMNQISEADANRSLTKHRKIASSFRDTQLFEIFQLSRYNYNLSLIHI